MPEDIWPPALDVVYEEGGWFVDEVERGDEEARLEEGLGSM